MLASCLKSSHLRTGYCYFIGGLSEVTSSSDRILLFRRQVVRSHPIFGQDVAFLLASCPKSSHLRTGCRFFAGKLSEVIPPSDWILLFRWQVFRSHPIFGQDVVFFRQVVRSHPTFGQDIAFSQADCPKSSHLRTGCRFFAGKLSEVIPPSDRILFFRRQVVRRQ